MFSKLTNQQEQLNTISWSYQAPHQWKPLLILLRRSVFISVIYPVPHNYQKPLAKAHKFTSVIVAPFKKKLESCLAVYIGIILAIVELHMRPMGLYRRMVS